MRFPCETVVQEFLTHFRHDLIHELNEQGWKQKKIALVMHMTQASISKHLKERTFHPIQDDPAYGSLLKRTTSIIEKPSFDLVAAMDGACRFCKEHRFPGNLFCRMHVEEIPELGTRDCRICSKYLDETLLSQGHEASKILIALVEGFEQVSKIPNLASILPEVQSNIVLGFKDQAKNSINDYAGFPGRLITIDDRVAVAGPPVFGVSRYVANILILVREFFPSLRTATCIIHSREILDIMDALDFTFITITDESARSIHDALSLAQLDKLDAVAFPGAHGLEPITYIFGTSMETMIAKIERIALYKNHEHAHSRDR